VSTSLAIAAATNALRSLLEKGIRALDADLQALDVTTVAPDVALKDEKPPPTLNLFLYQTAINAAWRNLDMPQVKSGEGGRPPLALNLHYLITPYPKDDGQASVRNHRILGAAMSVLHDHPVLLPGDIANPPDDGGLPDQFERLRITLLPLSIDEMSKLWSALQTNYRVSVAYEVTVLLIESNLPAKAPLPVLKRGKEDRGPEATASSATVLREARPPRSQPAARLGEELVIAGDNLQTDDAVVRFSSLIPPLEGEVQPPAAEIPPLPGDKPDEIKIVLDDIADDPDAWGLWAPGMYTLSHVVAKSDSPRLVSNSIGFALAPAITLKPNSTTSAGVKPGAELTITCTPRIRERETAPNSNTFETIQRVIVLFGDQPVVPTISNPHPLQKDQPTTIKFKVPALKENRLYVVRLRVDNVDSIPVILEGPAQIPAFDPLQQIKAGP
jgi:hypothetical protein